jgi:hypothetical protein
MVELIVIGILYAAGFGIFHALGGIDGVAEVFQRWGQASASVSSRRARD